MTFANYACRICRRIIKIRDKYVTRRARSLSSKPLISVTLEEEIADLRRSMEQMADREQSLTSPKVIELSMLLDSALNRYMSEKKRA